MKRLLNLLVGIILLTLLLSCSKEEEDQAGKQVFSEAELDQMVAPIALYPDPLLAQVLMASTYPADVAEAAKWSKAHPDQQGDAAVSAVQDKPWDPSVMSLVAFPQVMDMMGQQPDWVQRLGDAFLADPGSVMDAAQRLRLKAKEQGNLKSNQQQTVIVEQQSPQQAPQPIPQQTIIKIEPTNPQVVYVPAYNPTVVYGTWWYPHYQPFYYYPPPYYGFTTGLMRGIGFGLGIAITNSLWGGCNWGRGYGRGNVNINVNRYNNINVNKRMNVNRNNVNWKHNSNNRGGVPYRDSRSREQYGKQLGGADKRRDFRGRDAERDRARTSMQQRGMDPAKERKQLQGAGGDKVREQVSKQDRSRATATLKERGIDPAKGRKQLQGAGGDKLRKQVSNQDRDRAKATLKDKGIDPAKGREQLQGAGGDKARQKVSQLDRGKAHDNKASNSAVKDRSNTRQAAQNRSRNNALVNAGHSDQTRRNIDRGRTSNRSMQQRRSSSGGNRSRGGGGGRSRR